MKQGVKGDRLYPDPMLKTHLKSDRLHIINTTQPQSTTRKPVKINIMLIKFDIFPLPAILIPNYAVMRYRYLANC
jgi:hypothetical protein